MFRSNHIVKRILIAIGILATVLFLASGVLSWRSERRLSNRISKLRAEGEPTSLIELSPDPIPAEQNAAVQLEKIGPQLIAFQKRYDKFLSTPLGKSWQDVSETQALPNAEQLVVMKKIIAAFPEIPQAIAQAAQCTAYASRLNFNLPATKFLESSLDHVTPFRTLAYFADWKIRTLIAEGQRDDAVQLATQMLRLSRNYREPLLIHYFVSVGVQGIVGDALKRGASTGICRPDGSCRAR